MQHAQQKRKCQPGGQPPGGTTSASPARHECPAATPNPFAMACPTAFIFKCLQFNQVNPSSPI